MAAEPAFDLDTLPRRIHDLVERHAAAAPDALALIDHDGRCLTWHAFRRAVDVMEQHLHDRNDRSRYRAASVLLRMSSLGKAVMLSDEPEGK